ncbi:hypothetical protein F383_00033 [Gossypium arboreum]|uniref:Uncharacterized protein n=1 Tax=Gossypium arboreum TaxID=29729 RepID=A0A0B0PN08_GOSAR|nr:hypothetical protein F383_00033 [Gossypium arboreum]
MLIVDNGMYLGCIKCVILHCDCNSEISKLIFDVDT